MDIDGATAKETAALMREGGGAIAAPTPAAPRSRPRRHAAVTGLGPLDIMVNNAGILDGYFDVDEMDEAVWSRTSPST